MKCFRKCGIDDGLHSEISDAEILQREPNEFNHWFGDLLEVPWDEYLACDDEMEIKQPPRAPNVQPYLTTIEGNEDNDTDHEDEAEPTAK